jgi:hypothetical protein
VIRGSVAEGWWARYSKPLQAIGLMQSITRLLCAMHVLCEYIFTDVGFELFTLMSVKSTIVWDVFSCSLTGFN